MLPSILSGIFFGINNFFLGTISDLGISAAFLFCLGALTCGFLYHVMWIVYNLIAYNVVWRKEISNLIKVDERGNCSFNWANIIGLIMRCLLMIGIQLSVIKGFEYASKANMNSGIITSLFSLNCVFSPLMSYVLFNEQLSCRFIVGIMLSLACVVLVAFPDPGAGGSFKPTELLKHLKWHSNFTTALMFGFLTPVIQSTLLNLTRYLTIKHEYRTMDLSMDMYLIVGLIELPIFFYYN